MLKNLIKKRVTSRNIWTIQIVVFLALLIFMMLFVNVYNPVDVGPNGILIFFGLLYLVCFSLFMLMGKLLRLIFKRILPRKVPVLASVIAFAPVMLLAFNTLNQLEYIDIILVLLFEAAAIFYIVRRS